MKKSFIFIAALAVLCLSACKSGETEKPNPNVKVTGVTLNLISDLIEIGEKVVLTPIIAPFDATNENVTWSSSSSAIAEVSDSGVVTGIADGTATITVKTEDGNFEATCEISVAAEVIDVVSISLNATEKELARDEEFQLTPVINPEEATEPGVTWVSADPAIASVSNDGIVKGLTGGITTVKATTQDGGLTAECVITVNVPLLYISATPDEIGPDKEVSIIPGQTVPVTVSFTPEDALNQNYSLNIVGGGGGSAVFSYEIDEDNKNVVNVTGNRAGTASLMIRAEARNGSSPIEFYVAIEVTTVVTSITFNPASYSINPEDQVNLAPTMTVAPNNAFNTEVTWSSSDTNIATVNDAGVVTAVAGGEATITATAKDGSETKGTCTIFVKAPHPIFGTIGFESEQTWEVGGWIWSDYVTASRCKTDAADFNPTAEGGDCLKNDTYYDLFSYYAVRDNMSAFCTEGWSNPWATAFTDTDTALYPIGQNGRSFSMGFAPQRNGAQYWVDQWGLEYGGYWNGTAIVREETVSGVTSEMARLWFGGSTAAWTATTRGYIGFYKEATIDNSTLNRGLNVTASSNWALGLRCVKKAS